jgi:hypothetical protein
VPNIIRRKASSFEEYWLASKAWQRKGLSRGTGRALVNAGFLTVDDLHTAHDFELATIPRVGAKSLAKLCGLIGRTMPDAPRKRRKRQLTNPLRANPKHTGQILPESSSSLSDAQGARRNQTMLESALGRGQMCD